MRARLATAAVALALASPASAHGYALVDDLAISPDGRHLYTAGDSTMSYSIDPATRALTPVDVGLPGWGGGRLAISPDGRFVYVGLPVAFGGGFPTYGEGTIFVFSRDPKSGLLTHESTVLGKESPDTHPLAWVVDVEVSHDGARLYVLERSPATLVVYDRNPADGRLTERQVLYDGRDLRGSTGWQLVASPDGRYLYVAGDGLTILRIDPASGLVTQAGGPEPNHGGRTAALSPDGGRLYVGEADYATYRRDAETGALEPLSRSDLAIEHCAHCGESLFVSPTPDGRAVLSTHTYDARLIQAASTETGVTLVRKDPADPHPDRDPPNPSAIKWTADGDHAYVAYTNWRYWYVTEPAENWAVLGSRRSHLSLYRWTGAELELVGDWPATALPGGVPASRHPAITIDDGAVYTNRREVEVTIDPPFQVASFRIANRPEDLATAPTQRLDSPRVAWRLDGGPENPSVRRVQVRFTPIGRGAPLELSDDIILDERSPAVVSAQIAGSRLRVRARDNRSGVKRLQVTGDRGRPGKARRFRTAIPVSKAAKRLFVRVFDGAGNRSRWRVARRR